MRFAVVCDEIDVGEADDEVAVLDGPAFHRVEEVLRQVGKSDRYPAFHGRLGGLDGLVSASINMPLMPREGWTDRQRTIVATYQEIGTQSEVAEPLGVSQQAVSATLRRADWPRLSRLESPVNAGLEDYENTGVGMTGAGVISQFATTSRVATVGGLLLLAATSGYVVRLGLSYALGADYDESIGSEVKDTGFVIGKSENVLVYVLILADAYTALALVLAAKSLVRREHVASGDTT